MRKRWLSVALVLALAFGTCRIALAEGAEDAVAGNSLKSRGKITYQNGEDAVVIDSKDLYMLAERIDLFKCGIVNQLDVMNTYFTTGDGISLTTDTNLCVSHTEPSVENAVVPQEIDFSTLLAGVAASQSVSSNVTDYDYPAGTELYRNGDGVLTIDGSEKGAERINVTAASADNLSAGTAAWVNGKLILGTGRDNKSSRDDGYKKGLAEGSCGTNVQRIDMRTNGYSCVVPEDTTGALVYIEGRRETPTISFKAPDGSAVPSVLAFSRTCYDDDGLTHRNGHCYLVPKIKANTVISVSSPNNVAYFVYFK